MGDANYFVKTNTTWFKFENWQAKENRGTFQKQEGKQVQDLLVLNLKIKNLLNDNPVETIIDNEEESIEVEKWVANDGDLYLEFDSSIRNQFPQLENDEFLKTVFYLHGYNGNKAKGYKRTIIYTGEILTYTTIYENDQQSSLKWNYPARQGGSRTFWIENASNFEQSQFNNITLGESRICQKYKHSSSEGFIDHQCNLITDEIGGFMTAIEQNNLYHTLREISFNYPCLTEFVTQIKQ